MNLKYILFILYIYIFINIVIYEPHCNHKPKICNRYAKKKKESKHQTINYNTKGSHPADHKDTEQNKERKKREPQEQPENSEQNDSKYIHINNYFKCIGLNAPVKRLRVTEWIQKEELYICFLEETHFRSKDTEMESESMERSFPCKWKQKESWDSNSYIRQNRV